MVQRERLLRAERITERNLILHSQSQLQFELSEGFSQIQDVDHQITETAEDVFQRSDEAEKLQNREDSDDPEADRVAVEVGAFFSEGLLHWYSEIQT